MNFMESKKEIKKNLIDNFGIKCNILIYDDTSDIVLIKGDYETAPILISNVCLNIRHVDLLVAQFLTDIQGLEGKNEHI